MNNTITLTDDCLLLACHNTTPETLITASLSDRDIFTSHRWRWIDGQLCTTTLDPERGIEIRSTADSILLKLNPKIIVHHKNGDEYDYRRENLSTTKAAKLNIFTRMGDTACLLLDDVTVYVDTNMVQRLQHFKWNKRIVGDRTTIVTNFMDNGERKRYILDRYILSLPLGDNRIVIHKNGDDYDCRRQNLEAFHPKDKHFYEQYL